MKNSQKGFIFPLLIAIIAVLVIGGGVYYYSKSKSTPAEIKNSESWNGTYTYEEFIPPNISMNLNLVIASSTATLSVDGYMTEIRFNATTREENGNLAVVFDSYRSDNGTLGFTKGDVLFTLNKSDGKYIATWGKFKSNYDNQKTGEFKKTAQSDVIADSIAGWKTYTNTKYGFEFKYPKDWVLTEQDFKPANTYSHSVSLVSPQQKEKKIKYPNSTRDSNLRLDIYESVKNLPTSDRGSYTTLKDWVMNGNAAYRVNYKGEVIIGGLTAYKASSAGEGEEVSYFIQNGDKILQISFVINPEARSSDEWLTAEDSLIISTFKFISPEAQMPTSCVDKPENAPVITSLSSYSGPVGTKLQIGGCNFNGFEGDLNVWIKNAQGTSGILYSEPGSTAKSMNIVLKPQACQTDESYRGLPCASYLNLTPGTYKIYTIPWGKKSNEATFTIK